MAGGFGAVAIVDVCISVEERVTSFNFDIPKFTLIPGSNPFGSASLRCDHCRDKMGSPVHHYWRMHFCSANCMSAYQQRLSADTCKKILELDVDHSSLKPLVYNQTVPPEPSALLRLATL
jgi:hypothetical protein